MHEKTLFQIDDEAFAIMNSHGIPVKSVARGDGMSHAVSARVCSVDLCIAHNLISREGLKVGQTYTVIFEVFRYDYHGKVGNAVRAYITKLEKKQELTLPASVAVFL